jgi:hypothetical protein
MIRYNNISSAEVESPNAITIAQEIDKKNALISDEIHSIYARLMCDIESVFGKDSKAYKYMKHQFIPSYHSALDRVETHIRSLAKKADDILKATISKQQEQLNKDKTQRAVLFLLNKGLKLGTDFNLDTAIFDATNIVCEDARKEMEGKTIKIQCCSECSSWIGGEHRCSCGNRRMYWDFEGDFENWSLNPYAD